MMLIASEGRCAIRRSVLRQTVARVSPSKLRDRNDERVSGHSHPDEDRVRPLPRSTDWPSRRRVGPTRHGPDCRACPLGVDWPVKTFRSIRTALSREQSSEELLVCLTGKVIEEIGHTHTQGRDRGNGPTFTEPSHRPSGRSSIFV